LRFSSTMSTAIALSASFAHLMELPSKMRYEPSLYVRLHRTLYPNFGRIAGPTESLAVLTTGGLAWLLGKRRSRAFQLTAAAAGCLAAAHAVFWALVAPVNKEMMSWPLDEIPSDWAGWRDQWEFSHAARALLTTGAMGLLIASTADKRDV
jgi:hypothetical protein